MTQTALQGLPVHLCGMAPAQLLGAPRALAGYTGLGGLSQGVFREGVQG